MSKDRPAKDVSVSDLLKYKEQCEAFIRRAQRRISGQGGWIARDENMAEMEKAQGDLDIINAELKLR